jgi:hypothetical protein
VLPQFKVHTSVNSNSDPKFDTPHRLKHTSSHQCDSRVSPPKHLLHILNTSFLCSVPLRAGPIYTFAYQPRPLCNLYRNCDYVINKVCRISVQIPQAQLVSHPPCHRFLPQRAKLQVSCFTASTLVGRLPFRVSTIRSIPDTLPKSSRCTTLTSC